jgi:hypothetical protein
VGETLYTLGIVWRSRSTASGFFVSDTILKESRRYEYGGVDDEKT